MIQFEDFYSQNPNFRHRLDQLIQRLLPSGFIQCVFCPANGTLEQSPEARILYANGTADVFGVSSSDWTVDAFQAHIPVGFRHRYLKLLKSFLSIYYRNNLRKEGDRLSYFCKVLLSNLQTGVTWEFQSQTIVLATNDKGAPLAFATLFQMLNRWDANEFPPTLRPRLDLEGGEVKDLLYKMEDLIYEYAKKGFLLEIGLTAEHIAVLTHLASGRSNREIAKIMGVAETTIAMYNREILQFFRENFSTAFTNAKECADYLNRQKLF